MSAHSQGLIRLMALDVVAQRENCNALNYELSRSSGINHSLLVYSNNE